MDENVFRIVVTAAVALASLAFVVQAGVVVALYKATRKTQDNADRLIGELEPVISKVEPTLERIGAFIEKAGPLVDRIGPAIDQAMPAVRKAGLVLEEARAVVAKAGTFVERATDVAASANLVITEARPQIRKISEETAEITRIGREQAEHLGALVGEASDKARARLEQVDQSVEDAIEQVGQVGGAVKRAAVKPVREVNGIAAGISAAVATLLRGHRRSSVDSATQDEEMFI